VIHREREQLEVKQITEQLHETRIQPTIIQQRELQPEYKPAVTMRSAPIAPNFHAPSVKVDNVRASQVVHAPIIEETIRKTIIEEIQPVLNRDVIVTTVIHEMRPIYEKIIEPPRVERVLLPERELGVYNMNDPEKREYQVSSPSLMTTGKSAQFGRSSCLGFYFEE